MDERIEGTLSGCVGHFWPDFHVDPEGEGSPGHIHLGDDGLLVIDTIRNDSARPFMLRRVDIPSAIAAATTHSGTMLFDLQGVTSTGRGSNRVPTNTYRARSLVVAVPIDRLRSDRFVSLSAFFPGIGRWAGISGSRSKPETKDNGRLSAWSVELSSAPEQVQPVGGGRTLTLSTHWSVSGPEDRRLLYAPVSVTSSSRRPLDWRAHLGPLMSFQGLVNLAYQGFVVADGGQAEPDLLPGGHPLEERPLWWNGQLMRLPAGTAAIARTTEVPDFSLADLGGVAGLRRWLQLTSDHPRAVGPLVNATRYGLGGAETRLLEMAAAIEYWVAHQRRERKWTKLGSNFAEALGRHIGAHFTEWVGDVEMWSVDFWSTYNGLKHNPNYTRDPHEIHVLASSAALLLQCALLNRAGNTKSPSAAICSSHRNINLGRRVRELLGEHSATRTRSP